MADTITIRTSTDRDVIKIVERGPQGVAGEGGGTSDVTQVILTTGTTYSAIDARRLRVFVDRPTMDSEFTITLNTASPQNGDSVEVIVLNMAPSRKAVVSTSGFGNFDVYPRQSSVFSYAANTGPARWVKTVTNVYRSVPQAPSAAGQIGEIASDNNYLYFYVSNIWRRVPIANWS